MEDENGLELSLGLSFGGSSVKSKGKNASSSDNRTEEGDKNNKVVGDFKNFLLSGNQKQDSSNGSQRSDSVRPQESFFNDLSQANAEANASINLNRGVLWVSGSNRSVEVEEEKMPEAGKKHTILFEEINNQKKHNRDVQCSDLHDKKTSHISITTEDGSTAENEDVAESEVEGSTSRFVSHHADSSKRFVGIGGPSEIPKEVHGSSVVDMQGQNTVNDPFSVQATNVMNVPYSFPVRESNSAGASSTSGNPLTGMMQATFTPNVEQRIGPQSVNPGNSPAAFSYSPVQLPTLDKDNSWGLVSHLQQFHPSYAGRGLPNSDKHNDGLKISQAMQVIARNSSDSTQFEGRTLEWAKGDGKQHITEEGSSSWTEDAAERLTAKGISIDFSAIKPGVAADLKFGGCGSYPNLPWVSTTAPGPNGRTISGVTYRYNTNQIKIVCACHGSHMFPEEFVRHASEDNANPSSGNDLATCPSTNSAASAQS